jgi:alpha-beta hydrolase superfamily lysophospholipase
MRLARLLTVATLGSLATPGLAQDACSEVKLALLAETQNVECTASADLTTANPDTTPQDNSRAGLPPSAFTPRTDAQAVSPDAPFRTPLTRAVPGLQVTGGMADDPDARWVLRLPEAWNGKLVVGVPGGLRSEFMGDYIFSDFVVQQGYAYASTNKGTLNFFFTAPLADPLACRLSPPPAATSAAYVHFYIAEPKDTITEWFRRTREATELAQAALEAYQERAADRTYLMGISNGGHVVRRLLAESPQMYDGGIDWEGVYWAPPGPNILIDLPAALRPFRDYVLSGYSRTSAAHQAIVAAGYPPDIFANPPTLANSFSPLVGSLYETHANNYWDVTTCVFAKELDPAYQGESQDYDYAARRQPFHLSPRISHISTDGNIGRPLITLQGTMDALLPINRHARPFRDAVVAAGRASQHRLYEVQNGNHIERYRQSCCNFTQLEFLQPHVHDSFQRLVGWIESGIVPPASQCIPRGGAIIDNPGVAGRPERCSTLLAP